MQESFPVSGLDEAEKADQAAFDAEKGKTTKEMFPGADMNSKEGDQLHGPFRGPTDEYGHVVAPPDDREGEGFERAVREFAKNDVFSPTEILPQKKFNTPTQPVAKPTQPTMPFEGSPGYKAAYEFNTELNALLPKPVSHGFFGRLKGFFAKKSDPSRFSKVLELVNRPVAGVDADKFKNVQEKILLATLQDPKISSEGKEMVKKALASRGYSLPGE